MSNTKMVRSYRVKTAKKAMSSCVPLHTFSTDTNQIMEGAYRGVPHILDYLFTIPDFLAPWKDVEHPLYVYGLLVMGQGHQGAKTRL